MEKNQNETGMTLSFLRSDATHCTRKRMEKNACPRKPTDNQTCSVLIMVNPSPVFVTRLGAGAANPVDIPSPHLTGDDRKAARSFRVPGQFASPYLVTRSPATL